MLEFSNAFILRFLATNTDDRAWQSSSTWPRPVTVLLAGLLSFCALSQSGATPGEKRAALVFRHARVFDGARILPEATVLVQDGRITAVGPNLTAPADAQVIDATGKTLMPGLIDSHTHVFGPEALRTALIFGVTTELDMFASVEMLAALRKAMANGEVTDIADLRSAGTLVTAPGGHGTEYGMAIPTLSSPDQAQAFVDARLAEGSDYIKIVYDDGKTYGLSMPTLSQETLKAVVAAAHARKRLAVVHIGSLQGARDALAAGADGLAHLFVDQSPGAGFGKFVAAHKAFVVPTLTVLESVSGSREGPSLCTDPDLSPFLSPSDIAQLVRSFPSRPGVQMKYAAAEEAIRQFKAAHVPILAGTDAPNPGTSHGASLHRELELLVKAGLEPAEALAAATSVPAARFGLDDRGSIAPGKRADLLLVDGDPATDIKATRRIAGVWKLGVPVNREAYRVRAEKDREEAKRSAAVSPGSESGLVSDFEDGKPTARFGVGWQVSTDSLRGGKSTATFHVTDKGAQQSKRSLLVEGEVAPGLPFGWSGVIFYPGTAPMAPADLSAKKEISFWAKADGRTYSVMLFAASRGFAPAVLTFVPGPEWKQFTFPIATFDGLDGHDLMGLFIGAGVPPGKFVLHLDDVSFR